MTIPDTSLLEAALVGYQIQRDRLGQTIADIKRQLGERHGGSESDGLTPGGRSKRTMSPEARRRIGEAQRKRWAQVHKSGQPPRKRKMSAEGKKRIAEATRKRWAEYRAAKAAAKEV